MDGQNFEFQWKLKGLTLKAIGNRKERLRVRLRSEDKHHLRKSADRKAEIRKAFVSLTGLICAFRSADFLRWCLSSERNLTHNLFFLFPIVFSINFDFGSAVYYPFHLLVTNFLNHDINSLRLQHKKKRLTSAF